MRELHSGEATYPKKLLQIFETVVFSAGRALKIRFVLVRGGGNDKNRLWAANCILLFENNTAWNKTGEDLS